MIKQPGYFILLVAATLLCCLAQDSRQSPQTSTKSQYGNETCGSIHDIARKVEICAKPVMDILEGKVERWPTDDKDIQELCVSIAGAERCIRDVGRRCTKGLQKTIVSTVANSIARARKRECIKPKYSGILKTTQCVEKHQNVVQNLITANTNLLYVVEKQMNDLDIKTNGICCMVHSIEKDIRTLFTPICPDEMQMVVRLYRAILEDILELICTNPKCNDIFKGYKVPKGKVKEGIISVVLRIMFSLG